MDRARYAWRQLQAYGRIIENCSVLYRAAISTSRLALRILRIARQLKKSVFLGNLKFPEIPLSSSCVVYNNRLISDTFAATRPRPPVDDRRKVRNRAPNLFSTWLTRRPIFQAPPN